MFGQAMATFIPPMLPGTTIFMRGLQPGGHRRAGEEAPRVGRRLGAEDPRRARRARAPARVPGVGRPGAAARARRPPVVALPRGSPRVRRRSSGASSSAPRRSTRRTEEFWSRLGFVVIQGYGLTETAPIVSLNHPFAARKGSVGKAIAGVEVRIAPDGEILVRGENVTRGYFGADRRDRRGVRGRLAAHGRHRRDGRGRPAVRQGPQEGDDRHAGGAERLPGGRRAGAQRAAGRPRVGRRRRDDRRRGTRARRPRPRARRATPERVVREANARLADHQRIRGVSTWPRRRPAADRGHAKAETAGRSGSGWRRARPAHRRPQGDDRSVEALLARYAGGRALRPEHDDRGTRPQLARPRGTDGRASTSASRRGVDEARFADARTVARPPGAGRGGRRPQPPRPAPRRGHVDDARVEPRTAGQRPSAARASRRSCCRSRGSFARARGSRASSTSPGSSGPVVFASNHQSHLDTPVILAALPRPVAAPRRRGHGEGVLRGALPPGGPVRWRARLRSGAALRAGRAASSTRSRCRSARPAPGGRSATSASCVSDGWSVLIYPEGAAIGFRGGRAIPAGRRDDWRPAGRPGRAGAPGRASTACSTGPGGWPRPGRVRVSFGPALELTGEDYAGLARHRRRGRTWNLINRLRGDCRKADRLWHNV